MLARYMEIGRWFENAVPICFGEDGYLLDGQHRLLAIVKSGRSQWIFVARGIAKDAYDSYDQNQVRTSADLLGHAGKQHAIRLAAALRALFIYRMSGHFGDMNPGPSRFDVVDHYPAEPQIDSAVEVAEHYRPHIRAVVPSMLAALYQVFREQGPEDVDEFFERWATGIGIVSQDDPIYLLRRRLEDPLLRNRRARIRDMQGAIIIKAWKMYRLGESGKLLRWTESSGELYPEPV